MDLDDSTVYTNETGKQSTLTPLYAILQAKDHESEIRHPQETLIDHSYAVVHCSTCCRPILDRYVFQIGAYQSYHQHCLKCVDCGAQLNQKCFVKQEQLYCKNDFYKRFGNKCACCGEGIAPAEIIHKAGDLSYHLDCFHCNVCDKRFETGDQFFLLDDKRLVCKEDYEDAKLRDSEVDGDGNMKRPRTTITAKQLDVLKQAYQQSSKPARHVRESLSTETGLDMRVVQVWFQNRRAKEKRLKKEAGRQRSWNKSRNEEPLSPADSLDQTIISPSVAFSPENQAYDMYETYATTAGYDQVGTTPVSEQDIYMAATESNASGASWGEFKI